METAPENTPGRARRIAVSGFFLIFAVIFLALCIWQIQRRSWKLALIHDVDQRVHASAASAPGPSVWPTMTVAADRYRHVAVSGHYLAGKDTETEAVTELGGGFWVLTPFVTDSDFVVLINRGFTPADQPPVSAPTGERRVTGLLRFSEPKGGFLRDNQPAADRWYSRDVAAIAVARHLRNVAPYFIDRDADGEAAFPQGGLTVVSFPNNHLVYAITWFALAIMSVAGFWRVISKK